MWQLLKPSLAAAKSEFGGRQTRVWQLPNLYIIYYILYPVCIAYILYSYMRAGQTSPHMEYGMRYDFYVLSEKRLPVDIIIWLIRRSLETIWRFEVIHIVPNFSNLVAWCDRGV